MEEVEMASNSINAEERNTRSWKPNDMLYRLKDRPAWLTTITLAFQNFLMLFSGCMVIPFLFAPALCIEDNLLAQCYLISTVLFVSGISTMIQTAFGVRLPIAQGGSFGFIVPALSICNLHGACPSRTDNENNSVDEMEQPEWKKRLLEVQGAIIVTSFIQMFAGVFGLIGLVQLYFTPIVITPTIGLIGLSLFEKASETAGLHWGLAAITMVSVIVFSQYLRNVNIPCNCIPGTTSRFPLFRLFPVLFGIFFGWFVAFILTVAGGLPDDPDGYGYSARTDIRLSVLSESPWFRIPYPCQWGIPTVTVAGVIGMSIATFITIIESLGDYYACARFSGAPPVPGHAMNRGIAMEGVGCLIDGLIGSGSGTTSYSQNIGAIGITKVASRTVTQVSAIIMLVLAVFSKFGALFVCIPSPVIGSAVFVLFSMIVGAGLSNLQFIDLNSSRNNFIVGFSFFLGLALPNWISKNNGVIDTGVTELDQAILILLKTNMFVGGFTAFILDNTVPGTVEERGILKWQSGQTDADTNSLESVSDIYDLPFGMEYIRRSKICRYLPFSPTFRGFKHA
ncbi:solute carrier family 23 member 1-like [Anneissia japonica]|uniref:solute carrier family 23 member 1-like n=1 Tax=Anneissia japonica TaxID=1529436 RepID=UPI001425A6BC|nr:solute carrier family 23 member 1-like [Anneissia japonica]